MKVRSHLLLSVTLLIFGLGMDCGRAVASSGGKRARRPGGIAYFCRASSQNSFFQVDYHVTVGKGFIVLEGHRLDYNPNYHPRTNAAYLNFDGDTSFLSDEEGVYTVLVRRDMASGRAAVGAMKITARTDTFESDYFTCYRR